MTLFVVVHLIMVLLSGPINGIRSMITGRHVATPKPDKAGDLA
jgi:thiosulfate reductase cytochrome b subunit